MHVRGLQAEVAYRGHDERTLNGHAMYRSPIFAHLHTQRQCPVLIKRCECASLFDGKAEGQSRVPVLLRYAASTFNNWWHQLLDVVDTEPRDLPVEFGINVHSARTTSEGHGGGRKEQTRGDAAVGKVNTLLSNARRAGTSKACSEAARSWTHAVHVRVRISTSRHRYARATHVRPRDPRILERATVAYGRSQCKLA